MATFFNWTSDDFPPLKLAKVGIIFTEEDNIVIYTLFHVEGCRWVEGDDRLVDHMNWSSTCLVFKSIFPEVLMKEVIMFTDQITVEGRLQTFDK